MTAGTGRGRAALVGGLLALAATVLLPFHLGGGLGTVIAAAFLGAGIALAIASIGFGGTFPRAGARWLHAWALLGAAGFVVSGAGLALDVLGRAWLAVEIAAVVAVAAWWTALGWRLGDAKPDRAFARFSLLCGVASLAALAAEVLWEPPAGAVPARFAYVLWGPWGLWLARVAARRRG